MVEPTQADGDIVKLRIKLSNGENLQRLFLKSDTLEVEIDIYTIYYTSSVFSSVLYKLYLG